PWDVAAGALILKEAGGVFTTLEGKKYSMNSRVIIASNGLLQEKLVENIGF
ncbi:MAG: inositol monophosphatase, partial [Campylobacteraceae bacterium]|nr:inositol monophosphatase [Campylobacteraceae bacterium]